MSNPPSFRNPSFDPFAAAPAAPSSRGANGGIGVSTKNPLDYSSLGSFASTATHSGNGLWKTVVASSTTGSGIGRVLGSNHSASSTTIHPPRKIQRIVPCNGNNNISTLETNWDPWIYYSAASSSPTPNSLWKNGGNFMTYLIVQTNAAPCFTGGGGNNNTTGNGNGGGHDGSISVENVLKWKKSQQRQHGSSRNPHSGGGEALLLAHDIDSSLSLASNDSTIEEGIIATTNGDIAVAGSSGNYCDAGGDGNVAKPKGGGGGMQRFLKSNLKKAQQSIERSVAAIAIKADIGKNPDQICVALHYLGAMNSSAANVGMARAIIIGGAATDVGLSRTEWAEFPSPSGEESRGGGEGAILFSIPLCVPDLSFLETDVGGADVGGGGVRLTIRMYVRSGATLLKAMANNREHCIGECTLLYSNIMQARHAAGVSSGGGGPIRVPFTSGLITEIVASGNASSSLRPPPAAALLITTAPRIKFNPPCSYGWSLTDPISTPPLGGCGSGNNRNWPNMFQLPLDSGFVFRLPGQGRAALDVDAPSPPLLLANERAVESTLVLPLATACSRLFARAAARSKTLTTEAANKLRRREAKIFHPEFDERRSGAEMIEAALLDGSAFVEVGVKALILAGGASMADIGFGSTGGEISSVKVSLSFQPPHCIFEESLGGGSCPLFDEPSRGTEYTNSINSGSLETTIMARFCPRIFAASDDFLLPGIAGTRANGKHVGAVRFEVAEVGCNNNGLVDNIWTSVSTNNSCVEGLIELEDYLEQQQHQEQILIPAICNGRRIGSFVVFLHLKSESNSVPMSTSTEPMPAATLGLVAMAGLSPVTEGMGSFIDSESPPPKSRPSTSPPCAVDMRKRQIETMGSFVNSRFLMNQPTQVRDRDATVFNERYERYNNSLKSCMSKEANIEDDTEAPLFKRRMPRAFRPSSSRDDANLTGLGFNVHVQSLSLNVLLPGKRAMQLAVTQSVTHGAPADHARGFFGRAPSGENDGKQLSEDIAPRGGLRRLELKRLEIAKELDDCVTGLISAIGNHFKSRAQTSSMRMQSGLHTPSKPSRHVPPNLQAVTHYRDKAGHCAKRLHSLTWDIAVRRSNCFSQVLGIAVTSYMASLSDGGPAMSKGLASVWIRHGYLVTFEGLLSAVGKELGMIEDASVAISMLRMVYVVLVPDDGNTTGDVDNSFRSDNTASQRINVPQSPYVRWISLMNITAGDPQTKIQYRLEIGLDPSYFQTRIPDPLKSGAAVRFFPVLFQMGVDIRQWGVNAGRSVASQMKDKSKQRPASDLGDLDVATDAGEKERGGSMLDDGDNDDDDNADISDNEILYVLNFEGYRKLNAYAHSVYPATSTTSTPAPIFDLFEQQQQQQAQLLPVHPLLATLSDAIKTSAGKMEHSILDRAASATQRFGGGSTVFCKSGKDRTAMQVTFKQAQFVQRHIERKDGVQLEDTPISYEEVVAKSGLMRKHGIRIPICEKNTGEPRFAFNPLQRKFMPEMLRPEASLCTWSKPET